jgi:hypothetical protein
LDAKPPGERFLYSNAVTKRWGKTLELKGWEVVPEVQGQLTFGFNFSSSERSKHAVLF